jgi:hypothetical protein
MYIQKSNRNVNIVNIIYLYPRWHDMQRGSTFFALVMFSMFSILFLKENWKCPQEHPQQQSLGSKSFKSFIFFLLDISDTFSEWHHSWGKLQSLLNTSGKSSKSRTTCASVCIFVLLNVLLKKKKKNMTSCGRSDQLFDIFPAYINCGNFQGTSSIKN